MDGIPLNDWEDVAGTPFPPSSGTLPLQSPAPPRPLYDEECSIFPPRDHEGLPIMAVHRPPNSDRPQTETGRHEGEDGSGGYDARFLQARVRLLWATKALSLALRVLWRKIQKLYSIFCGHWRFAVTSTSFPIITGGSALAIAALLLLINRQRYWRGVWRQNAILLLQIQEKDQVKQKIHLRDGSRNTSLSQEMRQLRLQLSQAKEVVSTFHIPVLNSS